MTERQERLAKLLDKVDAIRRQIDILVKEPITREKIASLLGMRGELHRAHTEALALRVKAPREAIEAEQERVREALGIGAPAS